VKGWAYLYPELVPYEPLDSTRYYHPSGSVHDLAVGVKHVIWTKDMPTQQNSCTYISHAPALDAGRVAVLRQAGAVMLGNTRRTADGKR
jgi:amidase